MSFVSKLRMNRIFPTGDMNLGFTGQLPMYGGADPLDDIVDRFAIPREPIQQQATGNPSGGRLQQVASQTAQQPQLRFGGVVGDSNPGRDVMNRATANAERIYDSYSKPALQAGEILGKAGIKPNEQFPGDRAYVENLDGDKQLDREGKRVNIDAARRRIADQENRTRINEFRIKNPNKSFKVVNGKLYALDPQTSKIEDTGIAGLSREDELEIQHNNRLDEIDRRLGGKDPMTPAATNRDVLNRAQKFQIDYPGLAKYIQFDGNRIQIDADAYNDKDDKGRNAYDAIREALYPSNYSGEPIKPVDSHSTAQPPNDVQRIRVKDANGNTGWWNASKPLPQGYTRIQ